MFLFFSGELFKLSKALESTLNVLFQLSPVSDAGEKPDRSHSGGFLIRVAYVCLVKALPEAALLFMAGCLRQRAGSLRPGPGSWQDWMDPAEDISYHILSRQDLCFFGGTTQKYIELFPLLILKVAEKPGAKSVSQGTGSSSSLSLEVTWWFKCPCFLLHPLIPACVLLLLLEI